MFLGIQNLSLDIKWLRNTTLAFKTSLEKFGFFISKKKFGNFLIKLQHFGCLILESNPETLSGFFSFFHNSLCQKWQHLECDHSGSLKLTNLKCFYFILAAWVHRGFSDDVTEVNVVQHGADLITDFQKDKFRHFFFHVLDLNSDCVISSEDFEKLNEVIRFSCIISVIKKLDWSI